MILLATTTSFIQDLLAHQSLLSFVLLFLQLFLYLVSPYILTKLFKLLKQFRSFFKKYYNSYNTIIYIVIK
jgi:hypothetical protein